MLDWKSSMLYAGLVGHTGISVVVVIVWAGLLCFEGLVLDFY